MSDVVVENNNIINEIKDVIWKYYAISKISLRKTQLILNQFIILIFHINQLKI